MARSTSRTSACTHQRRWGLPRTSWWPPCRRALVRFSTGRPAWTSGRRRKVLTSSYHARAQRGQAAASALSEIPLTFGVPPQQPGNHRARGRVANACHHFGSRSDVASLDWSWLTLAARMSRCKTSSLRPAAFEPKTLAFNPNAGSWSPSASVCRRMAVQFGSQTSAEARQRRCTRMTQCLNSRQCAANQGWLATTGTPA